MNIFANLMHGFSVALTPMNVLYCFIGCFLGTIVGVLPGIANVGTMALLLPIS
jgi:putative tricarboxylic transport membrane protein